jgi:hypothetical protein
MISLDEILTLLDDQARTIEELKTRIEQQDHFIDSFVTDLKLRIDSVESNCNSRNWR